MSRSDHRVRSADMVDLVVDGVAGTVGTAGMVGMAGWCCDMVVESGTADKDHSADSVGTSQGGARVRPLRPRARKPCRRGAGSRRKPPRLVPRMAFRLQASRQGPRLPLALFLARRLLQLLLGSIPRLNPTEGKEPTHDPTMRRKGASNRM